MLSVKFCKKCDAETDRYADGRCKPCQKVYNAFNKDRINEKRRSRYADNPAPFNAANAAWALANPSKKKACDAAYYAKNREKDNKTSMQWRSKNADRAKAFVVAWHKANPEARRIYGQNREARKRASGGVLSKDLSAKLFKLQRGKCACCSLALGTDFQLDHIMPVSKGGPNIDSNIQLLRQRCNAQKGAKDSVEFMQRERGLLL